jgi:hypothetical protein
MSHPPLGRPAGRPCTRTFQRCRLEPDVWRHAYELAFPQLWRPASADAAADRLAPPLGGEPAAPGLRAVGGNYP